MRHALTLDGLWALISTSVDEGLGARPEDAYAKFYRAMGAVLTSVDLPEDADGWARLGAFEGAAAAWQGRAVPTAKDATGMGAQAMYTGVALLAGMWTTQILSVRRSEGVRHGR